MVNLLLSHKIEHKNPIESKYLPCLGNTISSDSLYETLVYNLETKNYKFYGHLQYPRLFNLPNDEILLLKLNLHYKKQLIFQFLHKGTRKEIFHDFPVFSAAYWDGYMYFFGEYSWKIKISDLQNTPKER
ncbi:unnamed protein product [Blepharisma stoltei]|uniref:Uncharacterized protein n=1 Tax=Blepharisma stoltei TaxID=1481888 RepID=A0AAU9KBI7_9CILI|nr:unnamed protein product [Blepharisma stoltei]